MKNNIGTKILHIDKANYTPIATVKQEDNITMTLELYKEGVEFDITSQTVTLAAKRSDKVIIEQVEGFSIDGNSITIDLKNNINAKSGIVNLELTIKDNFGEMSTLDFALKVVEKISGENNINAENELGSIKNVINTFNEKADNAIKVFNSNSSSELEEKKKEWDSLKKIAVDENNAAKLQQQINNVDSQLFDFAKRKEVDGLLNSKADKKEVFLRENGINLNDFDEDTREVFLNQQGISVNYVLGNDNVKAANAAFIDKSNLLYKEDLVLNKYVNSDGSVIESSKYDSYLYLELEQGRDYVYRGTGTDIETKHIRMLVFFDENKTVTRYMEYVDGMCSFKLNSNEKYISFSITNTSATRELLYVDALDDKLIGTKVSGDNIYDLNISSKEVDFIKTDNELYKMTLIKDRAIMLDGTITTSKMYSSYLYLKLDSNVYYYYFGDKSRYIRNIIFYDSNKNITRALENVTYFKLNSDEVYVSIAIASVNDVNKISKNSNFVSSLDNVNVSINAKNAQFVSEGNLLDGEILQEGLVVMPDGDILSSAMYSSYLDLELEENKTYYYLGDLTKILRTITFYNKDKIKTRCIENSSSFTVNSGEIYVSISMGINNKINKLSKNSNFENTLEGVKVLSEDVVGLEDIKAYDQDLNTDSDVVFNSVIITGDLPTGTLSSPPVGLKAGDVWADTTSSAIHPVLRVKL